MLRISVVNESATTQLKLEGKLAHEWVDEAHKAWAALTQTNQARAIVVDLRNVSFVDDSGHELLAAMRHGGAELIGYGPMMAALLEEIERTEVEPDTSIAAEKGRKKGKAMNL
jgi:anti-anti-sigma regulatory factor